MSATGVGELTYECREKKDVAGAFEWAFVGPVAKLYSSDKKEVGKYYAGPTWESTDGSKVTGKQVAVAPSAAGNIPMQLVKAEPATGTGAMTGISYIQRLNTKGGVAPATACTSDTIRGFGFSVTISQPAPTSCTQVPILETSVAIHNARNSGWRKGAQADGGDSVWGSVMA